MTKIKICGITNLKDALEAAELGVDALGFVFAESPRQIAPEVASHISGQLPPFLITVGVFVNEVREEVSRIVEQCRLSVCQFHGDELPSFCKQFKGVKIIKAFRVKNRESMNLLGKYEVDAYLLDTYTEENRGGTGIPFDWNVALSAKEFEKPFILSGGLCAENVASAIEQIHPYAVDVSSGVERSPGKKNYTLMRKFVDEVRRADRRAEKEGENGNGFVW